MAKKRNGHYCYGCGENRSNEKFSGKGHKQHLCKECKKAGIDKIEHASPTEEHSKQYYMKKIKNTLHLFHETETLLLFEYKNGKYIMETEPDFEIYQFQPGERPLFTKADEFDESINIRDALLIKGEGSVYMNIIDYLEAYDDVSDIEATLSKKHKRYIDLVAAIKNR